MTHSDALLAPLRSILGASNLLTTPEQMVPFLSEWRGNFESQAMAVALPANTEEVAAIVRLCASHGVAIVPQGGNTGLVGGAVARPDQLVLSLARMNSIRSVDPVSGVLCVDAGCTLAAAQEAAAAAGMLLPLSLASEGSCQVGGNLSTNAGGLNVVRFGTAREQVLGLEVVLPTGQVLDAMSALRKNTAGYDLKQWFIGAEGTLGIICGAALKLWPRPEHHVTLWLTAHDVAAALNVFARLRHDFANTLVSFEMLTDPVVTLIGQWLDAAPPLPGAGMTHVLMELHGSRCELDDERIAERLAALIDAGQLVDGISASSAAQRDTLWRWRHAASDAQKLAGAVIKHDIAVPIAGIEAFMASTPPLIEAFMPGCQFLVFGHIGDGNLHYNIGQPSGREAGDFLAHREAITHIVHTSARRLAGTISAEHGVGLLKRDELGGQVGEVALELMRAMKSTLDPQGLMNPGKIL